MTDLEHAKQIHERLWDGVITILSLVKIKKRKIPKTEDLLDSVVAVSDFLDVKQLDMFDWFYWKAFHSILCMYHKDGKCPCVLHCYVPESPYYQFVRLAGTRAYVKAIALAEQIRDVWR